MEIKNDEGKTVEVHLKEKWNEPFKRLSVFEVLLLLILILAFASMGFIIIKDGGGSRRTILWYSLAVFASLCLTLRMIIKMFKPAEYVVKINNDTLSIARNGTKEFSITSQRTKKIICNYYKTIRKKKKKIVYNYVEILEELPKKLFSSRNGYWIRFSYVPEAEVQEFLGLLRNFYGEHSELISYEMDKPIG